MKILHIADLHYSEKNYGLLNEAMEQAKAVAIHNNCELAIIAGDCFDHSLSVHEPAASSFFSQIIDLANLMPVCVLQGTQSHDPNGSFDILKNQHIARYPIWVADEPGIKSLPTSKSRWHDHVKIKRFEMAIVSVLPGLNRSADFDVESKIHEWSRLNSEARKKQIPTILVAHGTVNGAKTESDFAMISPDHEFSPHILAAGGSHAVMLGHIHKLQSWNLNTPSGSCKIAYSGSLIRLVHGNNNETGYLIWEIPEKGDANFQFRPIEGGRQMIDLTYEGIPDYDEMREVASNLSQHDNVRVRWSIDEEYAHEVDKQAMRDIFKGISNLNLEGQVNPIQTVRAPGITRLTSLRDKISAWAETSGENENKAELNRCLSAILDLPDDDDLFEEIVDMIIND